MTNWFGAFAVLGVAVAVILGLGSTTAFASPTACNPEHTIFWGEQNSSTGAWRFNRGTSEWVLLVKRDLDPDCTDHGVAWSTAHIANGSSWSELGFSEKLHTDGSRYLTWFTETGVDGNSRPINEHDWTTTSGPCNPFPYDTSTVGFRVQNDLGSDNWSYYVNCGGSTWYHVDTDINTTFTMGFDLGETGRRVNNSNATGMSDTRTLLKWRDDTPSLNDWTKPSCWSDPSGDNNWNGIKDSGTSYHVEKGSNSC